ncbi:MAG: NUDIX domain-containing protein [Jatrophihabitans sp.]|uniref:NUDIX domain-containing protein n=1 Tax=Jatrophihabitans sp. TaxID=1932789 RepID=UPI003F801E30
MAGKQSAGLLLYRGRGDDVEVLLGHMGGPFWAKKDAGAWSVPKGEYGVDEEPRAAAAREFAEELGSPPPPGPWLDLGEVRQRSGKTVVVWAVEGDLDVASVRSNLVEIEWPPRSGRRIEVPEIDRAAWFRPADARERIVAAQAAFVDRLVAALGE